MQNDIRRFGEAAHVLTGTTSSQTTTGTLIAAPDHGNGGWVLTDIVVTMSKPGYIEFLSNSIPILPRIKISAAAGDTKQIILPMARGAFDTSITYKVYFDGSPTTEYYGMRVAYQFINQYPNL